MRQNGIQDARRRWIRLKVGIPVGLALSVGAVGFLATYHSQTFASEVGNNGFLYFVVGPLSQGAFALYFIDMGKEQLADGLFPGSFLFAAASALNCLISILAISYVVSTRRLHRGWRWLALGLIYFETLVVNFVQDVMLAYSSF